MKVLSIKEPFASLVSVGIKKIETRSWKTNYRGEIYIHASLSKTGSSDKNRFDKLINLLPKDYELKYGNIICKCNLKDCIYMTEEYVLKMQNNTTEYLCGRYEVGRYAWILDDIEILAEPILAKGKLGIWNFEK